MPHQLIFAIREAYDTRLDGITIEARLGLGASSVICQAKIDTGGQSFRAWRLVAESSFGRGGL